MRARKRSAYYRNRIVSRSLFCRDAIVDGSLFCRDAIVDGSLFCRDAIVDGSLSCRDLIVDGSLFCRDKIVDGSLLCRDVLVDKSLSYKDLVRTTSLYCRDQLIDTIFETLRDIPVRYRNGEIIINERELPGGDGIGAGAGAGAVEGTCADERRVPIGDGVLADECGVPADGGEMKKIYILLTKHKNLTAILLRFFTWHEYTHSSIALERDGAHYSFNPVRGFTIERPIGKKRGETPCRLYCVEVEERTYAEIEARIKWLVDHPDAYKFNYVGLVFSILRIPIGIGNRYFCSQFVSDLLTSSEAAKLRKRPNRYFPRHFPKEDSFTLSFNGEAGSFKEE
jgi:hypothetical protein